MLFADDMVLCGKSWDNLETRLKTWRRAMEDRGMRVSRQKTEYLCIGEKETAEEVKIQGEKLKQVEEFKYLGLTIQVDRGIGREMRKKIQAGWSAWKKITRVPCDRSVIKAERQVIQGDGEASNAVWDGDDDHDKKAGEKNRGGRNKNAVILTGENKNG